MFPTFSGQGDIVVVEAVSRWLGKISAGRLPTNQPCIHADRQSCSGLVIDVDWCRFGM